MPEQTETHPATQFDVEQILEQLDVEFGHLPEEAIRAAQQRREEIIPGLIDLMRRATERIRRGEEVDTNGHFFALFLLTEFRAKEALPAVLEAITLPDEAPEQLFGDAITETLPSVLAELAGDSLDVLDNLISDRSVYEFVRSSAASTYLCLVRDGRVARERAVERLSQHLRSAIDQRDSVVIKWLVTSLMSYSPYEAVELIDDAFDRGLVDRQIVNRRNIKQSLDEGEERIEWELRHCRPTGVEDTVALLKTWYCFREEKDPPRDRESGFLEGMWHTTLDDLDERE